VPEVTWVVPQPVFELHCTVPVTTCDRTFPLRLIAPYWPGIVAVNVSDCPCADGFWLEPTVIVPEPAWVIEKFPLCVLFEPV
jgi:hypothetical protein